MTVAQTSICSRPDHAEIAVGDADGAVAIVGLSDGALMQLGHFDGMIRLWLNYWTAELRADGGRAELRHDGLVMRDAEIGAWWTVVSPMKWLCLVLAACGTAPTPALSNTAQPPAPRHLTPAEKFIADGLGPGLFGPDLVYARANPAGDITSCTTKRESDGAFTTWCAIQIDGEAFSNLDSLAVMQADTARAMNRGDDITQSTRDHLTDDLQRVRVHTEPTSRAFAKACEADGPVSCKPLGATAVVDEHGHVSLSFMGEIQGEVQLCGDYDKPVRPSHATVLFDSKTSRVLVVASAPQCDNAGFVMFVP